MSKTVGIIPARWNSTRFPGKPLHPIAGKPLLKHVWERCLSAKNLDLVVIATDDMRIASAAFGSQSGCGDRCTSIQESGGCFFSSPSEGRSGSSRQRSLFLSCADPIPIFNEQRFRGRRKRTGTFWKAPLLVPPPGHLWVPASDAAPICEMETKPAGTH